MRIIKISIATALMISLGTVSIQAEDKAGIAIFDNVKVKGEIRPRYEGVNENNAKPNANALTNRLVLGVNADLLGTDWLSTYVEMTDVHSLNNNYNGLDGKDNANSVVADPKQTRLTQSYLDFKYNKTIFRAGRQMVNLDNQRFIGAVGWRQMPQTFDAYAIVDNSIENLNILAAYVTQVNTIFADGGGKVNSASTETVLLNAKYKV
ncbi:alginate export family protein, partial [Sulfurimonas sp. MAG313]